MDFTITIPDSAIVDVTEYCRIERIDLQDRMQQELDKFVSNARENLADAKADWNLFKELVNAR